MYCARCHGVTIPQGQGQFWKAIMDCPWEFKIVVVDPITNQQERSAKW